MLDKDKISIRRARHEDIEELLSICRTLAASGGDCPWTQDYPSYETLEHDYKAGGLRKIMYGEKIAGIVSFGELGEFTSELGLEPDKKICDMARFGLAPEYHGSGLSVQIILMGQAMIKAEGYDAARLFVSEKQPTLICLYEMMGFHRVKHVLHHIGNSTISGYIYEKRRRDVTTEDVELTSEVTPLKLTLDKEGHRAFA